MIIKSNTFNFPFKILALAITLIGIIALINSHNLWTILLILLGLLPFIVMKGLDLSKNMDSIIIYRIYGFFFKSIISKLIIPEDLDYILYLKKEYSIRALSRGNLYYDGKTINHLYFVRKNEEKGIIYSCIDNYEGYLIGKFISEKLKCKFVEKKSYDNKVEKKDNENYDKTGRDETNNLNMITEIHKEK